MKKFKLKFLVAVFCLLPSLVFSQGRNQIKEGWLRSDLDADRNSIISLGGFSVSDNSGIIDLSLGYFFGTRIGLSGEMLAFYGSDPILKPSGDIAEAMVALGLISSPTLSGAYISGGSGVMDLSNYDITLPSDILLQVRHGTFSELQSITLALAELGFTSDTKELWVGDGTTTGGIKIGLSRQTGSSFVPPVSASVPDIILFSNTTTGGSEMQVQYATGKWFPYWKTKPNTVTGVTSTVTSGSIIVSTLGVVGSATSTGLGGIPGQMSTSGLSATLTLVSGSGGASTTAQQGGAGGNVSRQIAHQMNFQGGTGGAAGSAAAGGLAGDGGLGLQANGGAGGAGGSGLSAVGGSGGHSRPGSSGTTPSITFNGGTGGNGGTASGTSGGSGGFSGKINANGGAGGSGTTVGGGGGGNGMQIIGNGGVGAAGPFDGGNAGVITLSGGTATTSVSGGAGGSYTATGAAGHSAGSINLSASTLYDGPSIVTGSSDPEGVVPLPVGSIFRDVINGVPYFKLSGASSTNTGWVMAGLRVRTAPANSAAAGAPGQWFSDDSYFYFYASTGWRRISAGSTF